MKQRLDEKQIAVLESKGLPFNKHIEPTIGGLMAILPEEIHKKKAYKAQREWCDKMGIDHEPCVIDVYYKLTIEYLDNGNWLITYKNEDIACAHSIQKEIIDGLYDLAIWCMDKEYLMPLKNGTDEVKTK